MEAACKLMGLDMHIGTGSLRGGGACVSGGERWSLCKGGEWSVRRGGLGSQESAAVAQAAATQSSSFISFLLSFDYMAFLVGGFPVFAPLLALQGIHELGHAVVAFTKKVWPHPPPPCLPLFCSDHEDCWGLRGRYRAMCCACSGPATVVLQQGGICWSCGGVLGRSVFAVRRGFCNASKEQCRFCDA